MLEWSSLKLVIAFINRAVRYEEDAPDHCLQPNPHA
jgi:hypothetical protein